jgi:hypothetical protein
MANRNPSTQSNDRSNDRSHERNNDRDPSPSKKGMKQLVAAVERGEGDEKKSFWTRIGTAFENKDGSWNLLFDFIPTNTGRTTIQLRDIEPKQD